MVHRKDHNNLGDKAMDFHKFRLDQNALQSKARVKSKGWIM